MTALIAHATTLSTRVPFVHFFDGFRTSHELNTIEMLPDEDLRALVPADLVRAHRARAPVRASVHPRHRAEPGRHFQARETVNPFYARVPDVVQQMMDRLASAPAANTASFDYHGHPEAERVLVIMGSGPRRRARPRLSWPLAENGLAWHSYGFTGRSRPMR